MLDKNSNKIFASLSEYNIGSSIINFLSNDGINIEIPVWFEDFTIRPFNNILSSDCEIVEIKE